MTQFHNRRRLLKLACASIIGSSLTGKSLMATEKPAFKENDPNDYVFTPPPLCSLAVTGDRRRFPVRRIYCVGMNYPRPRQVLEQAPSLADIPADRVVIFDKHRDAIVEDGMDISYPQGTSNLVHEVELVVAIGRETINIDADHALEPVFGYAVGIDLTRRDLMMAAMESGGAVDVGKAFDGSAPCGPIHPVAVVGHPEEARLWLTVDGDLRQEGNLKAMLKKPAILISRLSHLYHLQPGDLLYTGTPGLPGTVDRGQTMVCGIDGLGTLTNKVI